MDHSEDKFDVFDQVDLSEDPAGDLGDPSLTAADLLRTSSQAEMGFKRKPPTSLLPNRGPVGDGCAGEITTQASPPLPKPQPAQTRSSSTPSQPPSPRSKLPPPP